MARTTPRPGDFLCGGNDSYRGSIRSFRIRAGIRGEAARASQRSKILIDIQSPLRVMVVDDEELSRQRIVNLLEPREDVRVVAEADNAEDALRAVADSRPDVLFLDIQMPEMDGFELLTRLGDVRPYVVLVTAYEEHALRGYQEDAVDFLLKPFDRARLEAAVERAARRVHSSQRDALLHQLRQLLTDPAESNGHDKPPVERRPAKEREKAGDGPLRKLVVKSQSRKLLVDAADIRWIEAADYYARIHLEESSHLIRRSLNWLEEHLDPQRFVRIHRSSIVNIDRVQEIVPWSGGSYNVRLDDGTQLRLSGGRKSELERLFGQSL